MKKGLLRATVQVNKRMSKETVRLHGTAESALTLFTGDQSNFFKISNVIYFSSYNRVTRTGKKIASYRVDEEFKLCKDLSP